jgi:hypothetical protein
MIRMMTYAAVAANPGGASEEDMRGALVLATIFGPVLASSIISGWDYDADGQLSMNEIFYDRDVTATKMALDKMSLDVVSKGVALIFQGISKLPGLF